MPLKRWLTRTATIGIPLFALGVPAYLALLSPEASDLQVGHIGIPVPEIPSGAIPYALAIKHLVLTTTTLVTGCQEGDRGEIVKGKTNLTITSRMEADPENIYYIYFEASRGKNINYSIELYDNGSLKSLAARQVVGGYAVDVISRPSAGAS